MLVPELLEEDGGIESWTINGHLRIQVGQIKSINVPPELLKVYLPIKHDVKSNMGR